MYSDIKYTICTLIVTYNIVSTSQRLTKDDVFSTVSEIMEKSDNP